MKKYEVEITETYTYKKVFEIEDDENIEDVVHDTFECPPVYAMDVSEFSKLNAFVENNFDIKEL